MLPSATAAAATVTATSSTAAAAATCRPPLVPPSHSLPFFPSPALPSHILAPWCLGGDIAATLILVASPRLMTLIANNK